MYGKPAMTCFAAPGYVYKTGVWAAQTCLGNRSLCWSGHVYATEAWAAPGHVYPTEAFVAPGLVIKTGDCELHLFVFEQ